MSPVHATRCDRAPTQSRRPETPRAATTALRFEERVALFLCAHRKGTAQALLEGFSEGPRQTASTFASVVAQWDSATRQARLTREFGAGPDAFERVAALIVEAPPRLRRAIAEGLPTAWRERFPHLIRPDEPPLSPALIALAARLVRETVR